MSKVARTPSSLPRLRRRRKPSEVKVVRKSLKMPVQIKRKGKLGAVLLACGLLLVGNSAYLAGFGDPNIFYVANSLLHPALGILAAILFVVYLARNRNLFTGFTGVGARLLLAASTGYGIFLAIVGMTRPHSLALYLHVGF